MIWAAYPPVLSPDGFSIIFLAEQNGTRELMMMKSDGTNIQALGEYGDGAIWSPDGQWIATGRTTSDLRSIVYLVSPDGGDGHIVFEGEKELLGINWLPDSQYLLITTYDIETDGRFLFLVFIEDGTFQPVTIPGIDPNQYVVQGISLRPLPSAP
jgi:Tol biopolymer transport system component